MLPTLRRALKNLILDGMQVRRAEVRRPSATFRDLSQLRLETCPELSATLDDAQLRQVAELPMKERRSRVAVAVLAQLSLLPLAGCNTGVQAEGQPLAIYEAAPVNVGSAALVENLPAICAGRVVIFLDTFDGESLDRSKWHTNFADDGCSLSGNNEQQCYTDQQVTVRGGLLHLTAIKQPTTGPVTTHGTGARVVKIMTLPYGSGMVQSGHTPDPTQKSIGAPGLFAFQYGYFEARLKIPAGGGLWPAFWTVSADGIWPPEIDALEILADNPSLWRANYHWSEAGVHKSVPSEWIGPDFSQDFHTIGVDWQPASITWYVDGVVRKTYTEARNITASPQNLILNLAVGGWAGDPHATTGFPAELVVDRVLVCQSQPQRVGPRRLWWTQ
jgi:beta-glucanase (GH16 family)